MVEKEYSPKSPGYAVKSQLIETLSGLGTNNARVHTTLLELGKFATEDMRISDSQSQKLIEALNYAGVLTYISTFLKSGTNPKFVDGIRWDLELDGKLQFHILSVLYQLNSKLLPVGNQIELLTVLLNKAHMQGFKGIKFKDFTQADEDGHWSLGLKHLEKEENSMVNRAKEEGYKIDMKTFRHEEAFDKLMAEEFIKRIGKTLDILKKLSHLEDIASLGFAMGVRDAVESRKRYRNQ